MNTVLAVSIALVFCVSYLLGVYYADKLMLQSTVPTWQAEAAAFGLSLLVGLVIPIGIIVLMVSL